jgi:hypothetical protein
MIHVLRESCRNMSEILRDCQRQMTRTHQSFRGASKIGEPLDVVDDSRAARRPRKGARLLGGRHGLAPRSRNSL